ncbi:MAG: hypothetical protein ISS36_00735 [Candidatus Aenigmarchaeota archaeon]|nr:hypothetical protein [Candidatus Aenigmarchaeota archaeon]
MAKRKPRDSMWKRGKRLAGATVAASGTALGGWVGVSQYIENEIDSLPFYLRWPANAFTALMPDDSMGYYKEIVEHPILYGSVAAGLALTGGAIYLRNRARRRGGRGLRDEDTNSAQMELYQTA